jgi:rhamnogalacturonyl hydrolase YesR
MQALFDALPATPVAPLPAEPPQPETGRFGNGVVKRAVANVMDATDDSMVLRDVQTEVERLLGRPVPKDSVNSCLSTGCRGGKPVYERVSQGRYRKRLSKSTSRA